MRLGAEVVDFSRLDLSDNVDEVGAVAKVAVMEFEFVGAYVSRVIVSFSLWKNNEKCVR